MKLSAMRRDCDENLRGLIIFLSFYEVKNFAPKKQNDERVKSLLRCVDLCYMVALMNRIDDKH